MPLNISVGAMLESPSLAYELDALAGHVDFISIGTNDLMQFFHAADRMVPSVSDRYDMIARPALTFLKHIADTCNRLNIPVSICGEAAGKSLEALALLAIGFRGLSMSAGSVGPIKRMVRSMNLEAFSQAVLTALPASDGSFRNQLLAIAKQNDIVLEDA